MQNNDHFVDARRRAQHLVDFCERLDERKFHDKQSALADAYSRLGNAYLELGDYNKALENHSRDLRIAETKQINDRRSRALDNLGRVYARSGQFPQAIQVWERKIPLATSPLEKAWLFHEIGQCQFGLGERGASSFSIDVTADFYLGDYEKSRRYGERSYAEAVSANDPVWQLNAKVLIAHSQSKLRQYREAEQTFNEALTLAKDQSRFTHSAQISTFFSLSDQSLLIGSKHLLAVKTLPSKNFFRYRMGVSEYFSVSFACPVVSSSILSRFVGIMRK